MIRLLPSLPLMMLLALLPGYAQAQTPVQQQAQNAAALGQGQMPAPAPADAATAAPGTAATVPAAATAPAAPATGANPGVVPGVSPSTAPAPESTADVKRAFTRSLFFTNAELVQIVKLRNGQQVNIDETGAATGEVIPQVRTITLTGVLYKNPNDWLIWLNGQKLNPRNLFKEIVDIEVYKDSRVRLKWYDIGLDGIIEITMRPHQKYDIVTGLLLPVPPQ